MMIEAPRSGTIGAVSASGGALRRRSTLPARTDVLVIGGGLAGCAAAYYLAKGGAEVTLIERDDINAHASGANAGSIHAQIPHEPFVTLGETWAQTFAPTIPLMIASIGLWRGLGAELGADLEFSTPGGLLVAETEAEMRDVRCKAAVERAHGLDVEVIGRDDLRRIAPYVSERMIGGAYCGIEGKANPLAATPAFAHAAMRLGVSILTRVRVLGLTSDSDGWAVTTDAGVVHAGRVVNCAGAEAGRVAALAGVDLAVEGHPIQVNVTEPVAPLVRHLVYAAGAKLSLKQTRQGALLIGGGWPSRRDPATGRLRADPDSVRDNLAVCCKVVPTAAGIALIRTWPAIVNGTADWRPIVGECPNAPRFFLAMFPWMGFTAGPVAAKSVADLVLGHKPEHDVAAFAPR